MKQRFWNALNMSAWTATALLFGSMFFFHFLGSLTWKDCFHLAEFCPMIGVLAIISGQGNLLASINEGKPVNIKARCIDFLHWFLILFISVGNWLIQGVSITWFLLLVALLVTIGWQIGRGIHRQWTPTSNEMRTGIVCVIAATVVGLGAGLMRMQFHEAPHVAWWIDTTTAVAATGIVGWWIITDMMTIRMTTSGYPRATFLKGLFNNTLIMWYLAHILVSNGGLNWEGLYRNFGLTFNVIVGNTLYLFYYVGYEYYRSQQQTGTNT